MPDATTTELAHHADEVMVLVDGAAKAHFRLVWIAGGTASMRTQLLRAVSGRLGCPHLSVGSGLSSALMEISPTLRAVSAEDAFSDLLRSEVSETLCLDHLEILFDAPLRLNAVALIKNASRRFVLVATWPGTFLQQSLHYGPTDHPSFTVIPGIEVECPIYPITQP